MTRLLELLISMAIVAVLLLVAGAPMRLFGLLGVGALVVEDVVGLHDVALALAHHFAI